ncbi:hypothetical protein GO495_21565 [Chitinophaga oryziterrae]|uniref:YD repeat-containing protein n=1 Tax=Chitinophaga oryziterrae TaxID=1031224 RepID=A0A6N8JDB2_9BACT|nr:hypothetical protein [Chitinophaga oryziterrae]MVT43200.1 hypothetical protein [Chitinophaga oryziterrae]
MKKLFLFLSLFIVMHTHAQMQTGTVTQNLIDVSTKSPDVASLGKFGNIPVSYATGVPSINIPVYEINVGKIKLPLSLDYHAGGIRVGEISSSVGIGWVLSGIGVISRQVVGIPDEDGSAGLFLAPNPDSVLLDPYTNFQYLFDVQRGFADNEPDQFSYSINGESGKFTFRRNGTIIQEPVSNNKISYAGSYFTITDQDGVVYIFGLKMNNDMSLSGGTRSYTAAWRLTKMVDANSTDTIFFNYEYACNPVYQKNYNYSHYLGGAFPGCNNSADIFKNEETTTYQLGTLFEAYPKEIRWRGGKISFINTCDRADVAGAAMRLTEADVYANQEGTLKQVKRMVLYQSYFNSNGTGYAFANATADQKKRLRLDSVGLLSVSGTIPPQTYRMTYDTTLMAPRESCAQDRWGHNNGAFDNAGLIPTQSVSWINTYYTIGNANRNTDSTFMKACTITSIQYPTKGKTVFEFEPHAFIHREMQSQPYNASLYCTGGVQSSDTAYFSVTANDLYFKYGFFLPAFTSGQVTDRPRIILKDLTSNTEVVNTATPPGQESSSYSLTNIELLLTTGHNYSFTMNTYSTSSNISASASITWTKNTGYADIRRIGGGLRIKTLTNYDDNGKIVSKEKYEYAGGVMLTDMYYQDLNVEQIFPRNGSVVNPAVCFYTFSQLPPGYVLIFHGNSVIPTSQCNGSPLLYSNVTKYQIDSAGNANGKIDYGYTIYPDMRSAIEEYATVGPLTFNTRGGPYLSSYTWKNNFLSYENTFKSTSSGYKKINSKVYDYRDYRDSVEHRLKIKVKYLTTCCLEQHIDSVDALSDFYLTVIDQPTGVMLLRSTSDTTWDDFGNKIYTNQQYEYNDTTHTYPTLIRSFTSTGDTISVLSKYPHDLAAAGNVYQKMMTRNIVSPLVQQVKKKNRVQLSLTNINYTDVNSNSKLLLPQTIDEQISNYPIETKLRFNKFDLYGNIQEQQKDSDIRQSYVWGYDTLYPIATVTNAAQNEIAHTSFEPDAAGYWTIPSATRDVTQGITGRQSYALSNGSVSRTGLTTTKSYIVSYWSKSSTATVNGTTATSSYNKNGWYYYEHTIAAGASSITVSGSVTIDELRLYPTDAQMNTFTYDPQVGMTTQCDADNRISYFEYDGFNRLKLVRDVDRNILKTYEYRYKQ